MDGESRRRHDVLLEGMPAIFELPDAYVRNKCTSIGHKMKQSYHAATNAKRRAPHIIPCFLPVEEELSEVDIGLLQVS